jgi:methionyl-tRNA formyltransferase
MTIHRIDAGQDTGPILAQRPFPVARGTEIEAAMRQAAELGAELLCQALRDLEQGRARFVPQPAHQYPKARVVRPDEPLVEWEAWDVERVWHFLRGTRPWLRPVRLPPGVPWRIGNFETRPPECPPATIGADKQGYYIAHRQGRIRLAA